MKKNIFINLEWLKKPDQLFIDTFNGFKKINSLLNYLKNSTLTILILEEANH